MKFTLSVKLPDRITFVKLVVLNFEFNYLQFRVVLLKYAGLTGVSIKRVNSKFMGQALKCSTIFYLVAKPGSHAWICRILK